MSLANGLFAARPSEKDLGFCGWLQQNILLVKALKNSPADAD